MTYWKWLFVLPWAVVVSTKGPVPFCGDYQPSDCNTYHYRSAVFKNESRPFFDCKVESGKDCGWVDDIVDAMNEAHQKRERAMDYPIGPMSIPKEVYDAWRKAAGK